ncbi:MAG: GntR family transcriptional regulator [Pseudolysinimonas sp.]|uniref:GntR family transcriptional regulator n=1 Tax=Pseudolysinimonas sp. TaxID=2680009 RepID=UPI003C727226
MRASDQAYARLREEILHWQLLPGTQLSEIELAERLGVSRTPLRAALARLALEGLVDTSRGRTGVVSDVSAASITDLFELREALETQAARLAARRCDPVVFDGLATRFAAAPELLHSAGADAYYALVAEFDAALDAALGNAVYRGALDGVRLHLARARRIATANPERLVRSAEEHRLICTAIRDGDAALAASATTVHLKASLTTILDTLAGPDSATQKGTA